MKISTETSNIMFNHLLLLIVLQMLAMALSQTLATVTRWLHNHHTHLNVNNNLDLLSYQTVDCINPHHCLLGHMLQLIVHLLASITRTICKPCTLINHMSSTRWKLRESKKRSDITMLLLLHPKQFQDDLFLLLM